MECELCGKNTKPVKARIEGTVISVCEDCANMGQRIYESKPVPIKGRPKITIQESSINPDFAEIVKNARESKNLKREELARKISERVSVIERIEHGNRPTDSTARKLEKALNVKILGFQSNDFSETRSKTEPLTLGDVVQIKHRKK